MNLIWFRNDLRIDDNPALQAAINTNQPCQAIFISTPQQWQQHDLAPIKIDFIERHLNLLSEQLGQMGIPFTHLESSDFSAQSQCLLDYCQQQNIDQIFANQEVELNERLRDDALSKQNMTLHFFESDVIVAKGAVLNGQGEMYKVFTPFKKAWATHLMRTYQAPLPSAITTNTSLIRSIKNPTITFHALKQDSSKWPLANVVLQQVVPDFLQHKLSDYHHDRDFPTIKGTSGLSP